MKNPAVGLIGLINLILIITLPQFTSAQDTCFLRDAKGRSLNLSSLCGQPNKIVPKNFFQIPIKRRVGGVPTVEVLINGKHTVEMLFDTGASVIVINQEIAQAIGIPLKKGTMLTHTAGGVVESKIGQVTSIQVGTLVVNNVEVFINAQLGLPGLLGQPFYANYDVTIKKNVIELKRR